jgi:hypothetical protein
VEELIAKIRVTSGFCVELQPAAVMQLQK